jgi:hypothetical protein
MKEENIRVFPGKTPSGKSYYDVKIGDERTRVWAEVKGYKLNEVEAVGLVQGMELMRDRKANAIQLTGKSGNQYGGAIFPIGIKEEEVVKDGTTYHNRTLEVGTAVLNFSEKGYCNGYLIDGVQYRRFYKLESGDFLEIGASDAYQLSQGQSVEVDGHRFQLDTVEEKTHEPSGRIYKNAMVSFTPIAEAVEELDQEPAAVS